MPNPAAPASFPRRRFTLYIPFDKDYADPYEITFPISDSVPQAEDTRSEDGGSPPPPGAVRNEQIPVATQARMGPPDRGRPSSDSGDESDEGRPYDTLLDRNLHGKGTKYYYYRYNTTKSLTGPPPRPPDLPVRIGTIFIHRNPNTRVIRSWILEASDDGEEQWTVLQELYQRPFNGITYYYSVAVDGTPSWVTWSTARKRKYYLKPLNSKRRRGGRGDTPVGEQGRGADPVPETP
ncbi:hypothetical protein NMY22_g4647 [Coprinellus aureogranulatus]|nr:hypothetical protein NMY22_g4647 [Coprinellus aureogranulatus]